jgi:hypothetical protein
MSVNLAERIDKLENEVSNIKKMLVLVPSKKKQYNQLLNLYGKWEGEVETFFNDFYQRRNRRGRSE